MSSSGTPAKRLLAFHGGPRQHWNTATLIEEALEGARAMGAATERVELYDLDFKGCRSCFACKTRGGQHLGRCAQKDELSPMLDRVREADAILIGSPIYLGSVTGETRSFLERLLFPLFSYTNPPHSLLPKRMPVGMIYTMGNPEQRAVEAGYGQHLGVTETILELVFGKVERLASYDTLQFEDYAKVVADRFDPVHKARRHRDVFPEDRSRARELGARLVAPED